MARKRLLFWGSGKMAAAIAENLKNQGECELYFYSPSGVSAAKLAQSCGGHTFSKDVGFDYIILGHKPQQLEAAASELLKAITGRSGLVISLLAGTRQSELEKQLPGLKCVRLMPNTPIMVGAGLLGWYFGAHQEFKAEVLKLFKNCGPSLDLKSESELDAFTAIAGSGPAYLFELARILEGQYLALDLPTAQAREVIATLFFGSSKLMLATNESFEELRNNVTSKGGVTARALEVFQAHDLEKTVKLALEQNMARSNELAQAKTTGR